MSTKRGLSGKFREFSETTSFHGVRYISMDTSLLRRYALF